jgi:hypothetical protein
MHIHGDTVYASLNVPCNSVDETGMRTTLENAPFHILIVEDIPVL